MTDPATVTDQSLFVSPNASARRWLLVLGLGGLIPFVSLAVGSLLVWPYQVWSLESLIAYGASILAFLGALHWGHALGQTEVAMSDGRRAWHLIWGVVPSLVAWIALSLPVAEGLILLIAGLLLALMVDIQAAKSGLLGRFFMRLRWGLTTGATLSLAAALAGNGMIG